MQSYMQLIFNLINTSYWHPLIWIFAAGIVLYKMPKTTLFIERKYVQRWYWCTAMLLALPYILWAGSRTNFIDTMTYISGFNRAPSSLS